MTAVAEAKANDFRNQRGLPQMVRKLIPLRRPVAAASGAPDFHRYHFSRPDVNLLRPHDTGYKVVNPTDRESLGGWQRG